MVLPLTPPRTAHDGYIDHRARGSTHFGAIVGVTMAGIETWPPEGKLAAAVLVMMAVGGLLSKLVDEVTARD